MTKPTLSGIAVLATVALLEPTWAASPKPLPPVQAAEPEGGAVVPRLEGRVVEPPTTPPLWRWADRENEPWQDWHADKAIQDRLYEEAYASVREVVGVELPHPIDITIAPFFVFTFVSMEVGAKDGSLGQDYGIQATMGWLGFETDEKREPRTIGADWRGDPLPRISDATARFFEPSGIYSPQHVVRLIFVEPRLPEEGVVYTLRHELVHAMQDELYGLDEYLNPDGITIDERWARQAVEEGYATLVTNDEAYPYLSRVADAAREADRSHLELLDQTSWNVRTTQFLYLCGTLLVGRVGESVEGRSDLLTVLFDDPPRTTRQVLHPELYEPGHNEPLPAPKAFVETRDLMHRRMTGRGLEASWQTRLGELGLQCLLVELGMESEVAVDTAAGWRNDATANYGGLREPEATVSVWCMNGAAEAEELVAWLKKLITARGADWGSTTFKVQDEEVRAFRGSAEDRPDVLLARVGEVVLYAAGQELDALVEAR